MSSWLNAKVQQVCPRCGGPSSETSVLCEPHRLEAAERQSRWRAFHRPGRRRRGECAVCQVPSSTYRCPLCEARRRRWDAGLPAGPGRPHPQRELGLGPPAEEPIDPLDADGDDES